MRTDPTRRHVMAGMLLASARSGAPVGAPPPANPAFTSLGLSNTVWNTSGVAVTIGSVVAATDQPLTLTGATLAISDTTHFQFTNGGVFPCDVQAKAGVAAGDYPGVTLTITLAGASNSPYTGAPITLTGVTPGPAVLLTRTITNAGSGTPAVAFWNVGHPCVKGQVTTGSILTATFGGAAVRVQGFSTKLESDGSFAWTDLHVDLSGQMPAPGQSKVLSLSVATGSWSTTTNRTDADWAALVDTVEITNLSMYSGSIASVTWGVINGTNRAIVTTSAPHGMPVYATNIDTYTLPIAGVTPAAYNGTRVCTSTGTNTFIYTLGANPGDGTGGTYGSASAADLDGAGTWIATFDAGSTNIIWPYGSGALGLRRRVTAPFYNGATKHRFLMAVMEYWCTQKADGSLGPIMSIGPIIENCLPFKADFNQFNYDLAFKRNGVVVRSEVGVPHCGLSKMALTRYDGQGDWTANDPAVYVTQDYGLLGKTLKLPFWKPGIGPTYTGTPGIYPTTVISSINASTGVFTASGGNAALFSPIFLGDAHNSKYPSAMSFIATGGSMPTSLSAEPASYWGLWIDANTFYVYDTLAHAMTGGATGRVIPSAIPGGVTLTARLAVKPSTVGKIYQAQGNAGSRADIAYIPEWHVAWTVAGVNPQDWQRNGRIQTFAWLGAPVWALHDDDTVDGKPHILSCLTTALTPTSLRPSRTTAKIDPAAFSTGGGVGINGGWGPYGGKNVWSVEPSHMTNPTYVNWLLEGGAINQQIAVEQGARAIYSDSGTARRNATIYGTAYTGLSFVLYQNVDSRQAAWTMASVAFGAFAAAQGSDEETLLRNIIQNNVSAFNSYLSHKSADYLATGSAQYYEASYPPETATKILQGPGEATFMWDFSGCVWPYAANLVGDFITGMTDASAYMAKRWINAYTGSRGWYASPYRAQFCISESQSALPAAFVTDVASVGVSAGSFAAWTMDLADGTIHLNTAGLLTTITLANGDKIRPCNYQNQGGGDLQPWPAPFTDETDYFVVNLNLPALTMQLAATLGGTPIIPTKGTTTKTGATGAAGQNVILMSDTSGLFAPQPPPNNALGSAVTDSTGGIIPANSVVKTIVPNVSITIVNSNSGAPALITGAGVTAGDTLTFTCPRLSAFYIFTAANHGNPDTGVISNAGTGEDSYLSTQKMGLAAHADRGVTGADQAYGSTTPGNVGAFPRCNGIYRLEMMWSGERIT